MKKSHLFAISFAVLLFTVALLYHLADNGSAPTENTSQRFTDANAFVESGDFTEAITAYQSLIDNGERSASLYYNLAVAQHHVGDLGSAVLNFERAAVFEPGSADIIANLNRARKDAVALESEPNAWQKFSAILSADAWSKLAATALFGLAGLAAVAALGKLQLPRKFVGITAAVALLVIGTSATVLTGQHRSKAGSAIVLQPGTPLRVSPFDDAKSLTTLPAGKTVHLVADRSHENFRLALLPSGEAGWLEQIEVEPIITDP